MERCARSGPRIFFPIPTCADEGRVVVIPVESGTKIRVRQALKTKAGEFASKYYIVDFANPDDVKDLYGGMTI